MYTDALGKSCSRRFYCIFKTHQKKLNLSAEFSKAHFKCVQVMAYK